MELGDEVWVRHPTELWVRGTILRKQQAEWTLTIGLHNGEKKRVRIEGFVQTADVKLCNVAKDTSRVLAAAAAAGSPDAKRAANGAADTAAEKVYAAHEVDDLISLTHLHEPAILHALEQRYCHDLIYTATGPILIAINPFKPVALYEERTLRCYEDAGVRTARGESVQFAVDGGEGEDAAVGASDSPGEAIVNPRGRLRPHVYGIADGAYRMMVDPPDGQSVNQSILVSGESGAGKTVTTKIIVRYLATVANMPREMQQALEESTRRGGTVIARTAAVAASPSKPSMMDPSAVVAAAAAPGSIEEQVVLSNPILESFGNARTTRNDNSSRFGKFITIKFNRHGYLVGAAISTYLLEKVRIVFQAERERNYHVFYEMTQAPMPDESDAEVAQASAYMSWQQHVRDASAFHYSNQAECFERQDGVADDAQFLATQSAMGTMGFSVQEIASVFGVVAAIAHLGNMWFDQKFVDGADGSIIAEECCIFRDTSAKLLGVSADLLERACCSRTIDTREGRITVHLDPEQAVDARDALAKAVYQRNFMWLVDRVNAAMQAIDEASSFIGVLDIFGFEVFEFNGFEQLCINYANETLQQQFNEFVFKMEQREYERERIEWSFVDFPDNKETLELIEGRHAGLLALMDEECQLGSRGNDRNLAGKLYKRLATHPRFSATKHERVNEQFTLKHYAGDVCYSCEGFVDRNRDQLNQEAEDLLNGSANPHVARFFGGSLPAAAVAGGTRPGSASAGRRGRWSGAGDVTPRTPGGSAKVGGGAKRRSSIIAASVSSQFRAQLQELLSTVRATAPHYIRCLKPNDLNKPDSFHRGRIVEQLSCGGVLEAVRVSRAGFPIRLERAQFLARYFLLRPGLVPSTIWRETDETVVHNACRALLEALEATLVDGADSDDDIENKEEEDHEDSGLGRFRRMCRRAGVQVGLTKVFFRKGAYERLEAQRSRMIHVAATRVQAQLRSWPCRHRFVALRCATCTIQCAERVRQAYARVRMLRIARAATRVQRSWRAFSAARQRGAIDVLQRAFRSALGRSSAGKRLAAICAIQRLARCRAARDERRRLTRAFRDASALQQQLAELKAQVLEERRKSTGLQDKLSKQSQQFKELRRQSEGGMVQAIAEEAEDDNDDDSLLGATEDELQEGEHTGPSSSSEMEQQLKRIEKRCKQLERENKAYRRRTAHAFEAQTAESLNNSTGADRASAENEAATAKQREELEAERASLQRMREELEAQQKKQNASTHAAPEAAMSEPGLQELVGVLQERGVSAQELMKRHEQLEAERANLIAARDKAQADSALATAAAAAAAAATSTSAAVQSSAVATGSTSMTLSPQSAVATPVSARARAQASGAGSTGDVNTAISVTDADVRRWRDSAVGGWRDSVIEPRDAAVLLAASRDSSVASQLLDAPQFEAAERCRACNICFGIFVRRHHCRHCGMSFCDQHSRWQTAIPYYGLTEPVRCCEPCVKIIRITTRRNSALALRDSTVSASATAAAAVAAAKALGTPSPLESVEEDVVVDDDVQQEQSQLQAQAQQTPGADDSLGFSPSPTIGTASAGGSVDLPGKTSNTKATLADVRTVTGRRAHRNTMAAASTAPATAMAGAKPKVKGKKRRSVI